MKKELVSETLARAGALLFLHDLLRAPGPEQWAFLTSEQTRATWVTLSRALELPRDLGLPRNRFIYDAVYIAALEAGDPHPPIPLVESFYVHRDPQAVAQENLLSYSDFNLSLSPDGEQPADDLRIQLEFLAHTYRHETASPPDWNGADARRLREQIRTARRTYMERHLLNWLPAAVAGAERCPDPWISRFLRATARLAGALAAERVYETVA